MRYIYLKNNRKVRFLALFQSHCRALQARVWCVMRPAVHSSGALLVARPQEACLLWGHCDLDRVEEKFRPGWRQKKPLGGRGCTESFCQARGE